MIIRPIYDHACTTPTSEVHAHDNRLWRHYGISNLYILEYYILIFFFMHILRLAICTCVEEYTGLYMSVYALVKNSFLYRILNSIK